MKTSERLLKATSDIWKRYNEHPFVLGIEKGNLDAEKFKYYIVQDFMYLIDYTKVFAIGVAKAKSLETMRLFADYTHVLACSELNLHKGYMAKFKISQENINKTFEYEDFLLKRECTSFLFGKEKIEQKGYIERLLKYTKEKE